VQLEELKPGLRVEGLIPAEVATVIATQWHGIDALELTWRQPGHPGDHRRRRLSLPCAQGQTSTSWARSASVAAR
jgi:hypothetical protein